MKRYLIFLLLLLTSLLSACGAQEEEPSFVKSLELSKMMIYDYETGSFNKSDSDEYLYGVHSYQKEFYTLYDTAKSLGYIDKDLTENERTAYNNFFVKLENMSLHTTTIFTMESNDLRALFEANNEEIEAIDIFTFNSIKNVFDTLNGKQISITNRDFLEMIYERDLTSIEINSLEYFYNIMNEYYYQTNEVFQLEDTLQDTLNNLESFEGKTKAEDERIKIETAYNIMTFKE